MMKMLFAQSQSSHKYSSSKEVIDLDWSYSGVDLMILCLTSMFCTEYVCTLLDNFTNKLACSYFGRPHCIFKVGWFVHFIVIMVVQ